MAGGGSRVINPPLSQPGNNNGTKSPGTLHCSTVVNVVKRRIAHPAKWAPITDGNYLHLLIIFFCPCCFWLCINGEGNLQAAAAGPNVF